MVVSQHSEAKKGIRSVDDVIQESRRERYYPMIKEEDTKNKRGIKIRIWKESRVSPKPRS